MVGSVPASYAAAAAVAETYQRPPIHRLMAALGRPSSPCGVAAGAGEAPMPSLALGFQASLSRVAMTKTAGAAEPGLPLAVVLASLRLAAA